MLEKFLNKETKKALDTDGMPDKVKERFTGFIQELTGVCNKYDFAINSALKHEDEKYHYFTITVICMNTGHCSTVTLVGDK